VAKRVSGGRKDISYLVDDVCVTKHSEVGNNLGIIIKVQCGMPSVGEEGRHGSVKVVVAKFDILLLHLCAVVLSQHQILLRRPISIRGNLSILGRPKSTSNPSPTSHLYSRKSFNFHVP
jgi:hypothetical protein